MSGLGVPNRHHVRRALRADAVVGQDSIRGGDQFRPRENHRLADAIITFDPDEILFRVPQNFDEVREVFDRESRRPLSPLPSGDCQMILAF